MAKFLEKYNKARDVKNSVLCIGLDPSPGGLDGEGVLDFCLDMVECTSDYAVAYKPNSQFVLFTLNLEQLKKLNEKIHQTGCISILDHKLGDIGSSNEAAFYWIAEAGFDALTLSPFTGDIVGSVDSAHRHGLGLFILTLMSNPEAVWIQKETLFRDKPLYQKIAVEVNSTGADGLVIGTTDHVTEQDIRTVRELSGEETIFLCPGIGAQGGDLEKILKNAGGNILVNVGRAIISDEKPEKKAKEFRDMIEAVR